jgi:hypothetical protein
MKKILLGAVMLTTTYVLTAQEVMITKTTPNTVSSYSQTPPPEVSANFQANFTGVTVMSWEPMKEDWWYATYKHENGRINRVYYNTQPWHLMRGSSFQASLPVYNTFVPEAVWKNAVNNYGGALYSITMMKARDNQDVYHVTLIKNGVSEIRLLDNQGVVYTEVTKTQPLHNQ